MTDTQPVVDANAAAKPAADAQTNGAGDDLDSLLSQFETATAPPPPPPQPAATAPDTNALLSRIQTLEGFASKNATTLFKQEIAETVKEIRGDIDPGLIDDELVVAWLDSKARDNPALSNAWMRKDANPAAWRKVTAELGKSFAKKFAKMPDRQVTEDREAVTAAVRGASTKAPAEQAPNFASMDNAALRDEMRKLGIQPNF